MQCEGGGRARPTKLFSAASLDCVFVDLRGAIAIWKQYARRRQERLDLIYSPGNSNWRGALKEVKETRRVANFARKGEPKKSKSLQCNSTMRGKVGVEELDGCKRRVARSRLTLS